MLKTELIDGQVHATRAPAKSAILSFIEVFYNRVRLHGAPGSISPVDFANKLNQTPLNPAHHPAPKTGVRSSTKTFVQSRLGGQKPNTSLSAFSN